MTDKLLLRYGLEWNTAMKRIAAEMQHKYAAKSDAIDKHEHQRIQRLRQRESEIEVL